MHPSGVKTDIASTHLLVRLGHSLEVDWQELFECSEPNPGIAFLVQSSWVSAITFMLDEIQVHFALAELVQVNAFLDRFSSYGIFPNNDLIALIGRCTDERTCTEEPILYQVFLIIRHDSMVLSFVTLHELSYRIIKDIGSHLGSFLQPFIRTLVELQVLGQPNWIMILRSHV
jgi:hypothetical protein